MFSTFKSLKASLLGVASSGMIILASCNAMASMVDFENLTSDDLDLIDPNLQLPNSSVSMEDKKAKQTRTALGPLSNKELLIVKKKVLLDRKGFSPGAISAENTPHFKRIKKLFSDRSGVDLTSITKSDLVEQLSDYGGDVFQQYELTQKDVSGPFTKYIPQRIQDQGSLKKLNYMSARELIAERFHMDEDFLVRLNPKADFQKPGSKIKVTNIGRYLDEWVSRIHADKTLKQVTAFDRSGKILAVYPASIGSAQTPSPNGSFTVRNKAGFPAYTLALDNGFEKVDGNRQIVVAPGPNNPVGSAWIGLSKKTYGIHGTPEPSYIGRAESHGCIRLTNWDALELARLVKTGIEVTID